MSSPARSLNAYCRTNIPDGRTAQHYPLTVGNVYRVMGFDGSNVITTTDEPGREASYWRGRVERVAPQTRNPDRDREAGKHAFEGNSAPGNAGVLTDTSQETVLLTNSRPQIKHNLAAMP